MSVKQGYKCRHAWGPDGSLVRDTLDQEPSLEFVFGTVTARPDPAGRAR